MEQNPTQGNETLPEVAQRALQIIRAHDLASSESPVLLMVSGGSDSTALAYLAHALHEAGQIGPVAMLHVNHQLRGRDADDDARFVQQLAELLDIPLFLCQIDVGGEAKRTGENVEAVARRERYLAANEALESLCLHTATPLADGRIFTAHTADDRVESFYMRSIVGTGPGGFRAMRYRNGPVVRPLLELSREDLRTYLEKRAESGASVARDGAGALWREDATNAHTDHFRAYVRHEIVPPAKARNPQLLEVLTRTMNLIADEDDMLDDMATSLMERLVTWLEQVEGRAPAYEDGCVLAPALGAEPLPLQRRVVMRVLKLMLGQETRIDTAAVDAILDAWSGSESGRGSGHESGQGSARGSEQEPGQEPTLEQDASEAPRPRGGYVANIQGNLAVSANKREVRIEPMHAFRARRKRT